MKYMLPIILLISSFLVLEGAKILIALPIPWYSHTNTFMPVFKELAKRGHQVTMVSPFPQKTPLPNWTDLPINATIYSEVVGNLVTSFVGQSVYMFYPVFWRVFTDLMEVAFQQPNLQKVIQDENTKYDLVITEPFYAQEPLVALGHKLNAPVVAIHPLGLTPWGAYLTGNEMSFHLMPNIRTAYTNEMTFFQRLDNLLVNLIEFSVAYFHYIPNKERMMEKYMVYPGSDNRPSLLAMLRNVSLTLIDYHPSMLYSDPLQPNMIPVGGLSLSHIEELPKDLKDVMDNAKSGVIFLSFGSILRGRELEGKVISVLFETFSQLDQIVLMRWHTEDVTNKPKNVIIKTWMPQPSILAHPNMKLFITHAGLHGITEGAYFGVPQVCIPLFSDQEFDARFVEKAGFGTVLLLPDLTKENLLNNVNEVLKNPKYKKKALERSEILKDKPQTALESAVYWVEYIIKYKGASHLKPGRQELSLIEDLKDVMDNAKSGVIFLSFGSILRGRELEGKVISVLFETFSQLDQIVLMRWHTEDVTNKPKNVIIKTWMPQPSILAHPNMKLFITHAGLHGITEGAYFGVPQVCIPLFSDQEFDARFVEKAGFGTVLLLPDLTKENLLNNVNEVLKNPKYKKKALERSEILKDKPQTALESAVYWVEYIIKYKGASHLKPGRQELSLIEVLGLDIIMFILFLLTMFILVICKFVSFSKSLLCKNSAKTKKE